MIRAALPGAGVWCKWHKRTRQYFTKLIEVKIDVHILYDDQFIVVICKCLLYLSWMVCSRQLHRDVLFWAEITLVSAVGNPDRFHPWVWMCTSSYGNVMLLQWYSTSSLQNIRLKWIIKFLKLL
jgi:hypothetical protein